MATNIQDWARSLWRSVRSESSPALVFESATEVRWQSRRWTYFGGSDYFRLSWHARVRSAFAQGARRWGHDVAASRLTTGNHPLYGQLEEELASWLHQPSAVVCPSGFQAPTIAAQCMESRVRRVWVDGSAHACLQQAVSMLPARVVVERFEVAQWKRLRERVRRMGGEGLAIWTEGYLPRRSCVPPLKEYLAMLPARGWLLVDDAHGVGLLGGTGGGALEMLGVRDPRVILAGTLSKTLGAGGGFVAGPKWIRKQAFLESTVFAGATPVGLPYVEAALASLKLLKKHGTRWRDRCLGHAARVRDALGARSSAAPWALPEDSGVVGPVISLNVDGSRSKLHMLKCLLEAGIYPSLIRYPGGPGGGYFRFALSSEHSEEEVGRLCGALLRAAR